MSWTARIVQVDETSPRIEGADEVIRYLMTDANPMLFGTVRCFVAFLLGGNDLVPRHRYDLQPAAGI